MNSRLSIISISAGILLFLSAPPASAETVKTYWRYSDGYFEGTGNNRWEEHYQDSTVYHFVAKDHPAEYVELVDASRSLTVRLYDNRQEQATGTGRFRKMRDGGWGFKLAGLSTPPPVFNLCQDQTPIRDQGSRAMCPFFPPVAAMEVAYRRAGVNVNLSSEHLAWLRNVTVEHDDVKSGAAENAISTGGGGNIFDVITTYAVCPAHDMHYHTELTYDNHTSEEFKGYGVAHYDWSKPFSQFVLNRWNLNPDLLTPKVRADAEYGVDKIVLLPNDAVHNSDKLEAVLAGGHEIAFMFVIHHCPDPAKGQPPYLYHLDPKGEVLGAHINLIVGYDRPRHFFVVKDSGGPGHYDPNELSKEWKDIVKYDGFTLMDYSFLAAGVQAYYIAEVAPVGSPRFTAQRALGQWEVSFKRDGKEVMTGVLCWRRLPNHSGIAVAGVLPPGGPDLRIGDLVTRDGQQYRVNATLEGDGTKPYDLTLYINFSSAPMLTGSTDGSAWKGTIKLPKKGDGSFVLSGASASQQSPWGSTKGMELTAREVDDKNLLKSITPPKFSP